MIIRISIGSVSCSFTLKCCQLTEDVSCKCIQLPECVIAMESGDKYTVVHLCN